MEHQELIPHLFRTEFRKITAVLCKLFGIEYIQAAEDIAGETFLLAYETWPFQGIPDNPTAWLYTVAKNKAKNAHQRQQIFTQKVTPQLQSNREVKEIFELDLSDKNISDSQLQMLFTICHPAISPESQIGLSLRILCGFGIDEIANAFLTNKETINKRLFRAKEKLRNEKITIEIPSENDIHQRLESVLRTLYLLFSEGYYSESQDVILRKDLCLEAMRLTYLLIDNEISNQPSVNALMALMCFHASRFDARKNEDGRIILYDNQDETLWNQELISRGIYFLNQSAQSTQVTKYHVEASIAYWHTQKANTAKKWQSILHLYNHLLILEYSPIAALNRTFAFSKVYGKKLAIEEAEKLQLFNNHFYHVLLGELYADIDTQKAKIHFEKAQNLAKTNTDKLTIQIKIDKLGN